MNALTLINNFLNSYIQMEVEFNNADFNKCRVFNNTKMKNQINSHIIQLEKLTLK
jgi:hypothetical protein